MVPPIAPRSSSRGSSADSVRVRRDARDRSMPSNLGHPAGVRRAAGEYDGLMISATDLLQDALDRIGTTVHSAVRDLTEEQLTARVRPDANTIAWLVWHLTRVQDDHVADAAGTEQVWTSGGWYERFGLPFEVHEHGYGHSADDVAAVRGVTPEQLTGYYDAVAAATRDYVTGLSGDDLERVVDENWDPPVTLAVRLVSVLNDDLQHAGQAAYVRGLVT